MQAKNLGSCGAWTKKSQYILKKKVFSYKTACGLHVNKPYIWLERGIASISLFRVAVKELLMQQSPSNSAE